MNVPAIDTHSDALCDVLQATALLARRGQKPEGGGWQGAAGQSAFKAYLILHTLPGMLDGPVADANADLDGVWQVTAVGATQEQCEKAADLARTALLTQTITIASRAVDRISVDQLNGTRRDDTVQPPVWISTDRFRLATTPA